MLGNQHEENSIGDIGAQYLASALQQNKVRCFEYSFSLYLFLKTLTMLDLASNKIGDVGTQHLADALQNNQVALSFQPSCTLLILLKALLHLDLSGNQIEDNGLQYLDNALKHNRVRLQSEIYVPLIFCCHSRHLQDWICKIILVAIVQL